MQQRKPRPTSLSTLDSGEGDHNAMDSCRLAWPLAWAHRSTRRRRLYNQAG